MEMKKFNVSVTEVTNERSFVKDQECEYEHENTKKYNFSIMATTPGEAIEKVYEKVKNKKWYAIYCNEEIAPRRFQCHTKYNDILIDKMYEMYS